MLLVIPTGDATYLQAGKAQASGPGKPHGSNAVRFDRLSLYCRACGDGDVLDAPEGVITPARLSCMWPRCAECGSPDTEIT